MESPYRSVPVFGLKTALTFFLAWLTRSNLVAAFLTLALHNVALPLMPLLYRGEYDVGYWLLNQPHHWPPSLFKASWEGQKWLDAIFASSKDLLIDLKGLREELEFERKRERSAPSNSESAARRARPADYETVIESAASPTAREGQWTSAIRAKKRSIVIAAAGLLVVASAAVAYFYFSGARSTTINSVAVLPFVNTSKDPNTEYLSDGITDSLINSLSQLPNMRMIAHGSVSHYKGREADPQEVARELNVQAIVMGRITQLGDNLSINAELVDARTNSRLWGEQYNRNPTDILKVQTEIAREISERLRVKLTGEQQNRMTKRYTDNTEAYLLYTKGRYFWDKRTGEGMEKARESFNQATELDPNYALAYSGLADTYLFCYCSLPRHDTMPKAKAYAEKALAIDEALAEAHTSLGFVKMNYEFDWAGAESEFKRALLGRSSILCWVFAATGTDGRRSARGETRAGT